MRVSRVPGADLSVVSAPEDAPCVSVPDPSAPRVTPGSAVHRNRWLGAVRHPQVHPPRRKRTQPCSSCGAPARTGAECHPIRPSGENPSLQVPRRSGTHRGSGRVHHVPRDVAGACVGPREAPCATGPAIGGYSSRWRSAGPVYRTSGRMSTFASACSRQWAVQPAWRASANVAGNRFGGRPTPWRTAAA